MARFRLFGRPAAAPPAPHAPPPHARDGLPPYGRNDSYGSNDPDGRNDPHGWNGPYGWTSGAPPVGAGAPWPDATSTSTEGGPATRSARPAPPRRFPVDDPPTDPYGFPPVPAYRPAGDPPDAGARPSPPSSAPAPHPAEAAALAGAFAVDYLSWDQDDPQRRGRVLLDYLPTPGCDPARLGWSGRGRQRAELALPGLVRPDGDGRVLVDVRVRVTPYRSVGERGAEPASAGEPEPDVAGIPAAAPAPTGRGWRSLASYWVRLSVPVVLEGGRLAVDAWEETLGEGPEPDVPAGPVPDDHTLADDDPLVESRPGGGW